MPWLEIILQFLPLILELFKKDSQYTRDQALEMGRAMQRAAMKADNWVGIMAGGVIQRVALMDETQQSAFVAKAEAAVAKIEAAMQPAQAV